jgi:hypothetical protein
MFRAYCYFLQTSTLLLDVVCWCLNLVDIWTKRVYCWV